VRQRARSPGKALNPTESEAEEDLDMLRTWASTIAVATLSLAALLTAPPALCAQGDLQPAEAPVAPTAAEPLAADAAPAHDWSAFSEGPVQDPTPDWPASSEEPAQERSAQTRAASSPGEVPRVGRRQAELRKRFREIRKRWLEEGDAQLRRGLARLSPGSRKRLGDLRRRLVNAGARELGIAGGLLILLLLALRAVRKPGDLGVCMEYPAELRGTFSICLRTKKNRSRRSRGRVRGSAKQLSTKLEHYKVSRETQFHGLRPRHYWVTVEGTLEDPNSRAVLKKVLEERAVEITRGDTARLEVNLWPQGCPVEVTVLWDKRAARDASVSVFGQPYTLRYVRGGVAHIELPMGQQRIVVGGGDRVAELELEVVSHRPVSVTVDLGEQDHIAFKGCPLAVEPYLQGDLASAARELEREGQTELANLLLARLHEETGQAKRAAEHYAAAGRHRQAALLFDSLSQFLRAGDLYLRTGEEGDRSRAIELLTSIASESPEYAQACPLLAVAYDAQGEADKAIDKMEEVLGLGPEEENADLRSRLAELLEERGEEERALEVLEGLLEFAPSYPHINTRIDVLRKQISVERMAAEQDTGGQATAVSGRPAGQLITSGGRYDILEQIGRGGMGVVFKARDRRLGRLVALKQLPEDLREHPTAVQLFLSEAQSVAVLNHTNIVTLYDADQEGDKFFITMELLEGKPLNRILRKHGPIASRDCARLGMQVAAGLHYAHAQRIVHRDIKLSNLFYTKDKVVKIMDFGIAKAIEEVRRGTTVMGGTPNYMSPEQTLGKNVDARTDIYAFGVTLFEMLTGRLPFTEGDVAYHHCHTPPPDPRTIVPEIPEAFVALIFSMLEKSPEYRCASAEEAAKRLKPLAS